MLLELIRLTRAWGLTLTCGARGPPIIPDDTPPPCPHPQHFQTDWPLFRLDDGSVWRTCWCGKNGERAY